MLTALSIRDVVLIETLDLEFGAGLGVLTGETGAGKSILLDALGLALGARADSGLVRDGQAQAVVTSASICRPTTPRTPARRQRPRQRAGRAAGHPPHRQGGRRQPRAGQRSVRLRGAAARARRRSLVEIHGQHDDRGLLNPRGHRALARRYGRIDTAAAPWPGAGCARPKPRSRPRGRAGGGRAGSRVAGACRRRADALAPEPGRGGGAGWPARLHADRRAARGRARHGREQLEGSDGALSLLRQAARRLDRIAASMSGWPKRWPRSTGR
jgi:DNA repair protein RecN (Recombination protein N)